MRLLAIIILALGLNQFALCQDVLFMKSGIKIDCKIEEVGKMKIHFIRFDNDFSESKLKRDVLVVQYGNGDYYYPNISDEVIERNKSIRKNRSFATENGIGGYPKNKVFFNATNVLFGNLNFGYERVSKSGKFGLRVPFKVGFDNSNISLTVYGAVTRQTIVYSGGVDFLFYLKGNENSTYVNGIGIEGGRLNDFTTSSITGRSIITPRDYFGVLFYNGVSIQLIEQLEFLILGGIGPKHYVNEVAKTGLIVNFSFNIAYKF